MSFGVCSELLYVHKQVEHVRKFSLKSKKLILTVSTNVDIMCSPIRVLKTKEILESFLY